MIYVLTGPIRSGKTTRLQIFCKANDSIGGFLTPDIDQKRVVEFLGSGETIPFEANQSEDFISIGKFRFRAEAFEKMKANISSFGSMEWHIIDEVGKLELMDQGLQPDLAIAINQFKTKPDQHLILVIRDSLLNAVVKKFGFENEYQYWNS